MDPSRTARHPAGSARHLYAVGSERRPPPASVIIDTEPIVADEPFDWAAVEVRDREYVAEVLGHADRYCEERLDPEYATIIRRILARAAAGDPRPLRTRADAARVAAGLVWLALEGNNDLGRRRWRSRGLWAWFGVGNAVDRARKLGVAAGLVPEPGPTGPGALALTFHDPALLHSRYRIRQRELKQTIAEIVASFSAEAEADLDGSPHNGGSCNWATVISPRFGGSRPA